MAKTENTPKKTAKYKIKVTKNGPYLVSGGVPLSELTMGIDEEGQCHGWKETKKYPVEETYALCRCGHSANLPFCDGTHGKVKFEGKETASHRPLLEQAEDKPAARKPDNWSSKKWRIALPAGWQPGTKTANRLNRISSRLSVWWKMFRPGKWVRYGCAAVSPSKWKTAPCMKSATGSPFAAAARA